MKTGVEKQKKNTLILKRTVQYIYLKQKNDKHSGNRLKLENELSPKFC